MSGPFRRAPWPFDIVISGTGLMLGRNGPKDTEPLKAAKAQFYSDQPGPGDIDQESAPPIVELPHSWDDFSLGFGLEIDSSLGPTKKYRNCLGVDCSIAGFAMKGPLITT